MTDKESDNVNRCKSRLIDAKGWLLFLQESRIDERTAQSKVKDPDFKFVAWRPRMRTRRVLVPAPESAEEDAMEAILKEMETEVGETEVIDIEPESDEEIEEEIIEEEIIEEEQPEKKPGRIKGLVSGGGRDGVGKFGAVGDVIGGITDRIGVTDYGLAGKSAAKKKEKEEAKQEEVVVGDSSSWNQSCDP